MGRINKTRINFKKLDSLIKSLDKNVSIKVGIIGEKARQQHPDSDLTNAELGAVHEFGTTIQVTDKMRRYLHSQGLHLSPETTTVTIPTRSFLRMPLLSDEGKKAVKKKTVEEIKRIFGKDNWGETWENEYLYGGNQSLIYEMARIFGSSALERVEQAFGTAGFGNWEPISDFTRSKRYNPNNPPLEDYGNLKNSIEMEIKIQ